MENNVNESKIILKFTVSVLGQSSCCLHFEYFKYIQTYLRYYCCCAVVIPIVTMNFVKYMFASCVLYHNNYIMYVCFDTDIFKNEWFRIQ